MTQGTAISPSVFSRLMPMVLRGLTWATCVGYIDDTGVIALSFDEMVINFESL